MYIIYDIINQTCYFQQPYLHTLLETLDHQVKTDEQINRTKKNKKIRINSKRLEI